jgi:hypothetical protein
MNMEPNWRLTARNLLKSLLSRESLSYESLKFAGCSYYLKKMLDRTALRSYYIVNGYNVSGCI